MSKFVGKFRKNEDYSDDFYDKKKKHTKGRKNEHSEIKKLKAREYERALEDDEYNESLNYY